MSFLDKIVPPKKWQAPVAILLGAAVGLIFFVMKASNMTSYFTDDPKACINCHVMTAQYITWNHSSHREVATCNDCHVPQENIIRKYAFKAKDGLYHASIYTLGKEPQVIRMYEEGQEAVQNNCIRCHKDQLLQPREASWVKENTKHRLDRQCWECHKEVPHGRVRSLASTGIFMNPLPIREEKKSIVPEWMENEFRKNKSKQ